MAVALHPQGSFMYQCGIFVAFFSQHRKNNQEPGMGVPA
jgi:hypothetical protein